MIHRPISQQQTCIADTPCNFLPSLDLGMTPTSESPAAFSPAASASQFHNRLCEMGNGSANKNCGHKTGIEPRFGRTGMLDQHTASRCTLDTLQCKGLTTKPNADIDHDTWVPRAEVQPMVQSSAGNLDGNILACCHFEPATERFSLHNRCNKYGIRKKSPGCLV
jgi:hypothetical protein